MIAVDGDERDSESSDGQRLNDSQRATSLAGHTAHKAEEMLQKMDVKHKHKSAFITTHTTTATLRPMSHPQFCRATLSRNFVMRQNCKCGMACLASSHRVVSLCTSVAVLANTLTYFTYTHASATYLYRHCSNFGVTWRRYIQSTESLLLLNIFRSTLLS